tara:strand:+ start:484 stop:1635 length:1152 start_codon:yes stop_codon:yes gene_type:complete
MYFYDLPRFVELISMGDINPSFPIPLKSRDHNITHNISFLDHCSHLCKKHDTNILRLLSVIQQKLNGDMILRLNKSPVFTDKIRNVMNEWGEESEPIELFKCPQSCYDSNKINIIRNNIDSYDNEFNNLKLDSEDSNLYEVLEKLKNNYQDSVLELDENLKEIEERRNEYNPEYREILTDMSTKPKSFYMDSLLDKEGNEDLVNNMNMRINKGIPENVHVIFLNTTLIPNMISKCMEGHKNECIKLKSIIEDKQFKIDTMMNKVGPNIPLSDTILDVLSGIQEYFKDNDNELPSDDEEELNENDIQEALSKVVNKQTQPDIVINDIEERDTLDEESDTLDEERDGDEDTDTDEDMFFLKINQDDNKKTVEKEDKKDDDEISFF